MTLMVNMVFMTFWITAPVLLLLHKGTVDIPYTALKIAEETTDWLLAETWCAVVPARKS